MKSKIRRRSEKWILFIMVFLIGSLSIPMIFADDINYHLAVSDYDNAKYALARDKFETLGDYKESGRYLEEIHYLEGMESINAGDYIQARNIFKDLGDFKDSIDLYRECYYQEAILQQNLGQNKQALAAFKELAGYKESDARYATTLQKELMILAPDLSGASKKIVTLDGSIHIVYVALAGNAYGIKTGLQVGEYRMEVKFDGKQVGGVILLPVIVDSLLEKSGGKQIFIPADITEMESGKTVNLTFLDTIFKGKTIQHSILEIVAEGNVFSISNPIKNSRVSTLTFQHRERIPDYLDNSNTVVVKSEYVTSIANNIVSDIHYEGYFPLGQTLLEIEDSFAISSNDILKSEPIAMTSDDILKVGESVVFLKHIEPRPPSIVVTHGSRNRMEIAFTFDDGGAGLGKILSILNAKGIKGTFFLLARELRNNPERWRQAVRDGHEICNHTLGHRMDIARLPEEKMREQILGWEIAARQVLGESYLKRMKANFPYFRSPGGYMSTELKRVLGELGYPITAFWSHEDIWIMRPKNNPSHMTLTEYYIKTATKGDILLAHGGTSSIVEAVIEGIMAKGYRFRTLSEILR